MNFSINELMRMKKKDLVLLIGNLSRERDEAIDELSLAREEIKELSDQVSSDYDNENTIDQAKDILERIKASKWKFDLGVMTEQEEIENLNYKLEELFI